MKPNFRHCRTGEPIKVTVVGSPEQTSRIHEAVARRAFEISECPTDLTTPHEIQDWRKAESEVLPPFCCGQMSLDGRLWVGTDCSMFEEGTLEIWVSPRRLTICGRARMDNRNPSRQHNGNTIYHPVELPVRIDPSQVTAHFNGPSLEIVLRKAQEKREVDQAMVASP